MTQHPEKRRFNMWIPRREAMDKELFDQVIQLRNHHQVKSENRIFRSFKGKLEMFI